MIGRISIMAALLVCAQVGSASITVEWQGFAGTADTWIYNADHTDLPVAGLSGIGVPDGNFAAWLVELVVDAGNDNNWNDVLVNMGSNRAFLPDSDYVVATASFNGDPGAGTLGWSSSDDIGGPSGIANAGEKLYVKFYNADKVENSSEAGFVYNEGSDTATDWFAPQKDQSSTIDIFHDAPDIKGIAAGGTSLGTRSKDGTVGAGGTGGWHTAVPEPGSMLLMGLGFMVLGVRRKVRR